ncbi:MAG: gliding motility-associated lipoprotein GldD, partial [Sphingobacteriales bacterium]
AEDSRRFVFKHTVKADGIGENMIQDTARDVYGIYYTIAGNAASNIQFFLTDTNTHFLRGALYFNSAPQIDSIKPVLEFIKADIEVLMESLEWRD